MPYNALLQITVLCILQVKNKLQHACCMISFSYSSHVPMMVERPDFSDSLANIHTREFSESRTTWQHTNWKMLGFADARRPMKALFALTVLFSEPSRIQSCCTLSGEDKRFCSADHFGRTRRSAKTQQKSDNMLWRCTWRSSESWSVPNTCENAYITQKSMRVQTARLTMQCIATTYDTILLYTIYVSCYLLNLDLSALEVVASQPEAFEAHTKKWSQNESNASEHWKWSARCEGLLRAQSPVLEGSKGMDTSKHPEVGEESWNARVYVSLLNHSEAM